MLKQFLLIFIVLYLSACASNPSSTIKQPLVATTIEQRNQQLMQLTHWIVKGKIAFIENKKRQSATLFWQFNQQDSNHYQQIDLTTFLGINILHVESLNNHHTIEVDGKTYQGHNLTQLIYQLTGITLPTKALSYWLKGLAYTSADKIEYSQNSLLPKSLTSYYYQQTWQIIYHDYQLFQGYQLPTKLSIKQGNLRIKIHLNHWSIK